MAVINPVGRKCPLIIIIIIIIIVIIIIIIIIFLLLSDQIEDCCRPLAPSGLEAQHLLPKKKRRLRHRPYESTRAASVAGVLELQD